MITAIVVLVIIALIIEEIGVGAIIFWGIFCILILGGLVWILTKLTTPKYKYVTRNCPWGYHDYGCHPDCPMHEHCWGPHPNSHQAIHNDNNFTFDHDSIQNSSPNTLHNEDDDWRTTYMDDTRYDDREYDERHDDDRFENGGW